MKKEDYSLIIFTEFPNGRLLSFHSFALNGNWHLGQVLWVMKSEQRFWKSKISVAWRPDWWILQQFMEVHGSVIANRELQEKTIAYIESTRKSKHTRERETHTRTHTSHAHGEYQSVIWDYSSTEGGHFQHFILCGNTQNAQKRHKKDKTQRWTLRDKARQAVMKNQWYRDLLFCFDGRDRQIEGEGESNSEPETTATIIRWRQETLHRRFSIHLISARTFYWCH